MTDINRIFHNVDLTTNETKIFDQQEQGAQDFFRRKQSDSLKHS